jgi:hypothetical protein
VREDRYRSYEVQLADLRQRADTFASIAEAEHEQASVYRRQLIDAGLVPQELNEHVGHYLPRAVPRVKPTPTLDLVTPEPVSTEESP